MNATMTIAGRKIGDGFPAYVIAEAGGRAVEALLAALEFGFPV